MIGRYLWYRKDVLGMWPSTPTVGPYNTKTTVFVVVIAVYNMQAYLH